MTPRLTFVASALRPTTYLVAYGLRQAYASTLSTIVKAGLMLYTALTYGLALLAFPGAFTASAGRVTKERKEESP